MLYTRDQILWSVLFNILINDLDDGSECHFTDGKKLEVMCDTPDGCITIQKDIDRLKNRNLLKFRKGKCQVSSLEDKTPRTHTYRVRTDHPEKKLCQKDPGGLVDT